MVRLFERGMDRPPTGFFAELPKPLMVLKAVLGMR
jgi:hypothetical protein